MTNNDPAKFDDLICGYPCIIESCRKTFNFHNTNHLRIVCKKVSHFSTDFRPRATLYSILI